MNPNPNLQYVLQRMAEIKPRYDELAQKDKLDGDENTGERAEYNRLATEWDGLDERRRDLEERQTRAAAAATVNFNFNLSPDPFEADLRNMDRSNALGAGRTAIEKIERRFAERDHGENVTRIIDRQDGVGELAARVAMTTGSTEYRDEWLKYMTGQAANMTILQRATDQYRAMTAGTASSGGVYTPLYLDPTFVITGAGSYNPFRRVANVKTINTLVYNGGTTAQVTAGILGENVAFSDNVTTSTAVQITTYKYGAYIPASFEAFEDIDQLAQDVLEMFRDAKDNVEATQMATGSGSAPIGVVTAVGLITTSRVAPATGGAFAIADVYSLHAGLPARFWYSNPASKAWVMSIASIDKVRGFGATYGSSFLSELSADNPPRLLGDQLLPASAMSSSFTTGQDVALYGDFSRYLVIDRLGIQTEFIPNVVDGSGLPTGTRAWLMHWRFGANVNDANAFRLLRL